MSKIDQDVAAFLAHVEVLSERLEPPRRPQDAGIPECTTREVGALRALGQHGHLTMSALATLIDAPLSTASRIVEALVIKGLVERESSAADGRIVEVVLAPRGKRIDRYIRETRHAEARAMLGALPERERKRFLQQLAQLVENDTS